MLGAGAATIVSVLIAALIVTIDIAQASIAGVVVITAAAREAQKSTTRSIKKPRSRHVPVIVKIIYF